MKAHVAQAGPRPDFLPGAVQAADMLPGAAGNYEGIVRKPRDAGQQLRRLGRQRYRPAAGLGVFQPQFPGGAVDIVPLQGQDLVAPAAGQQQQAERRDRGGIFRTVPFGSASTRPSRRYSARDGKRSRGFSR